MAKKDITDPAPQKKRQAEDALAALMNLVSPISAAQFGEMYANDMIRGARVALQDAITDLHRYTRDRTNVDRGEYRALLDTVEARYEAFSEAVDHANAVRAETERLRDSCAPEFAQDEPEAKAA